jgi:hypothetical protein
LPRSMLLGQCIAGCYVFARAILTHYRTIFASHCRAGRGPPGLRHLIQGTLTGQPLIFRTRGALVNLFGTHEAILGPEKLSNH